MAKYSKFDSRNKKKSRDKYRSERKNSSIKYSRKVDYEEIDIPSVRRKKV